MILHGVQYRKRGKTTVYRQHRLEMVNKEQGLNLTYLMCKRSYNDAQNCFDTPCITMSLNKVKKASMQWDVTMSTVSFKIGQRELREAGKYIKILQS